MAVVQTSSLSVLATGNPLTAAVTFGVNITAGNALLLVVSSTSASSRTFTPTDNINGAWGAGLKLYDPGGATLGTEFWGFPNAGAGATTITVTHGNATGDFRIAAFELSGLGTLLTLQASEQKTDAGATNTHSCSVSGLTYGSDCHAVCGAAVTGTGITSYTAGSGYTPLGGINTLGNQFVQAQAFPSGISADTGPWTHAGTARQFVNAMIVISGNAAAAGDHPTARRFGGVPFMGGQGLSNAGGISGRMWGRSTIGLWVPSSRKEAA